MQKCIHFIFLLASKDTPRPQKQVLIETISKIQLAAISELALNVLKGYIPLDEVQARRLKRHRRKLRKLGNKRTTNKQRRQAFNLQLSDILLEPCVEFIKSNAESFQTL